MARGLRTPRSQEESSFEEALGRTRLLEISMLALQFVWLGAILWTGTSSDLRLISLVGAYSLLLGSTVILLPEPLVARFRLTERALSFGTRRVLAGLVLVSILIGVLYAFNQTPWGDEERSFETATIVSNDGLVDAYVESGWLRNKHPPLMPLVFGGAVHLLGGELLSMRIVSVLFLAGTVAVVYLLGRRLYDEKTGLLASLFFLFFPLVLRLGSAGMMDIEVAFFFAVSLLLCLRLAETRSYGQAVLVGGLIGLGLLTKYIMVMIFGVVIGSVILIPRLRAARYQLAASLLVAACVGGAWLLYAGQLGILSGQVEKILDYTGVYHLVGGGETAEPPVSAGGPAEAEPVADSTPNAILRLGLETMFTRLPSSLGVHLFPLMAAGAVLMLKRRTPSDVFLLMWIALVVVTLFLTLPDHRYFLSAFPAIAILIANVVRKLPHSGERVLLLAAVLAAGNLYLFVGWVREAQLFVS